jgi:hypothetical protein
VHRRLLSEPCTLQSAERVLRLGRPRWLVGRASRPLVLARQASRRVSQAKLFDAVAGPQQAERVLRVWVELGFGLEAV